MERELEKMHEIKTCLMEQVEKIDLMLADAGMDLDMEDIGGDEIKEDKHSSKKSFADDSDHKAIVLSIKKVMEGK